MHRGRFHLARKGGLERFARRRVGAAPAEFAEREVDTDLPEPREDGSRRVESVDGSPKTRVQEVEGDQPGVRVFVVDSEERKQNEQAMRERSMERTRVALENLRARVRDGKVRAREKIGAAAARILSRNHGHRYFDWTLTEQGEFRFFENRNLEREIAYEGKYLIQTEQPDLSPVDAVRAYKKLSEVERGFRQLKDVIEMRPIFHRKESRVRAHILVAALAFLLERIVEERLHLAKSTMSGGLPSRPWRP